MRCEILDRINNMIKKTAEFYRHSYMLQGGVFYYDNGTWRKYNRKNFNTKVRYCLIALSGKKGFKTSLQRLGFGAQSSMCICPTGWSEKKVVLYDEIVISYYKNKECFDNLVAYIDLIPYRKSDFYLIHRENLITVCKYVKESPYEMQEDKLLNLANYLIDSLISVGGSKFEVSPFALKNTIEIVCCCQHGDATSSNFIWADDGWVAIDLDMIRFRPLLYDFFRLVLFEVKQGLHWFVNGLFDDKLSKLFDNFGVNCCDATKDIYLSAFINHTQSFWGIGWMDINEIPMTYVFTRSLIPEHILMCDSANKLNIENSNKIQGV